MIPYGKQDINQDDIDAVVNVLKSDYLTQGPAIGRFEQSVSEYCGAQYAVAVNSATSALHIACLALGVGKRDYVWTSPNSFVASSNCAIYCDATVDFVDIDVETGNISIASLRAKLQEAKNSNKLPKVIIPVHFAGQSCDMAEIAKLANEYHFKIIEDASHAIGAKYQNSPVGNCQFSDICVFSFHPVKIITSAEGGMLTTKCGNIATKLKSLRSHGVTNQPEELEKDNQGPWYYEQQSLGFNYRITDIQAALGLSQMKRLDEFVTKRHQLTALYTKYLPTSLTHLMQSPDCYSSYHLYVVLLDNAAKRKEIVTQLRARGIFAHVHYIPIHLQPFYRNLGFRKGEYPNAEEYYSKAITLPLHPNLTENDIIFISDTLRELM
ncbi:UDP-4-amino-4,6-dideoxy-N-acetyl-beta-L-altrosamine transaminase [Pseudoalteromonas sp. P1-9]|uniref:UDP-4-amino-4, 6-dideoxy-N-acetyl-beta-L-altrosamine transaminase n=1 Tax=Pseudoalteromonas sp. P1-9 TaxID=1710354 RepID=UPI0006D636CB|nr:UDP-4-amino-4,6-dideoxy-N-acetyl-beta-L-altrosamine transaminase [Pseudoalteromonas sp. P1-9]KPV97317.1 UDP-4-amino-4,6-dideoxy-N-acetyl-beta-L-altrosamine transaminase [Pseudoalteromonas sp. P1-9]